MGCPRASPTMSDHAQLSICVLCEDCRRAFKSPSGSVRSPWVYNKWPGGWVGVPLFRMPHLPALLMDANYPVKLSFLLNQEMVSECSRKKPSPVDYSWHGRWNLFAVLALAHGSRDHVIFVFGARHIRASTNQWVSEWILTSIFAFTMDSAVTPIKANGFNQGRISSLNTRISLYEKRNVNRTLIREFTNYSSLLRTLAGV